MPDFAVFIQGSANITQAGVQWRPTYGVYGGDFEACPFEEP